MIKKITMSMALFLVAGMISFATPATTQAADGTPTVVFVFADGHAELKYVVNQFVDIIANSTSDGEIQPDGGKIYIIEARNAVDGPDSNPFDEEVNPDYL